MKNFLSKRIHDRLAAGSQEFAIRPARAASRLLQQAWSGGFARHLVLLVILLAISATPALFAGSKKTSEHFPRSENVPKVVVTPVSNVLTEKSSTALTAGSARSLPDLPPETAPVDTFKRLEGTIGTGDTLGVVLNRRGVSHALIHSISSQMRPLFDFRKARPGDKYHLVLGSDGQILRFRYVRSVFEEYLLEFDKEAVTARRLVPKIDRRRARISGLVNRNLYDSLSSLGGDHNLATDFSEIFAWDVDFSRSVRVGDRFAILYERLYTLPEGQPEVFVGSGKILAASYLTSGEDLHALYFENEVGRGGYYRPDGTAMQRQFLKAPLEYRRISSSYSLSRLHPILKVRRPHRGIDYAAPAGTPVWAVADGTLTYMGRNGGFGKLVKVRHANGYVSYYGHLSRYRKGLKVGSKVSQKEIVGYVGSTGLATGPHLDYRLRKDGKYVDPNQIRIPSGRPISEDKLASFGLHRDQVLSELETANLTKSAGSL